MKSSFTGNRSDGSHHPESGTTVDDRSSDCKTSSVNNDKNGEK